MRDNRISTIDINKLFYAAVRFNVMYIFAKEPKKLLLQVNINREEDPLLTMKFAENLARSLAEYYGEFNQNEVLGLHQKRTEGINIARFNENQARQKEEDVKKLYSTKEIIKKYNKAFGGTLSNKETWELAGVSKTTFYKYKKEILREDTIENE